MSNGHAKFSPSTSGKWLSCTMSMILPSKKVEQQANEYSTRGTALHSAAEDVLNGNTLSESYDGYIPTVEDIEDTVIPYVEYVNELKADIFLYEQQVRLSNDCYGTADVIAYDIESQTVHVVDLKAGQGVFVKVLDNTQIQIYAIGAILRLAERGLIVKKVKLHIVQPGMGNYGVTEVSLKELEELASLVTVTINKIKAGEGDYAPSTEACRWCEHKVTCPKLNDIAQEAAMNDFSGISLGEKMDMIPHLKTFIKAVESEVLADLQQDKKVVGYKMVKGQGNRKFSDVKAVAVALTKFDEGLKIYVEAKLLSVAQMEKLLKKEKVKDFDLDSFVIRPEGAPKVVKDDDLRSEIDKVADAKEDFK